MSEREARGVLTEGVVQTFPTRGAAVRFQGEHAIFWGRKSPLMTLDGEHWVHADGLPRPAVAASLPMGEAE